MNKEKLFAYLGFAAKAKTAKAGEQAVLAHLKKNKVKLLIISETAQEKSIERWKNRAQQFDVPYIVFGTQEELGYSIGTSYKTIVAIIDDNIAKAIMSLIT